MLSKVSDQTVSVKMPKSVETLLEKYTFVSDVYRAGKHDEKAPPHTATYGVWELACSMTAQKIKTALAAEQMRPATVHELLCFAEAHPEACDPALVAIGSAEHIGGHTGVPVVTIQPDGGSRAGEMFVERFPAGTHVLAVKIQQDSR